MSMWEPFTEQARRTVVHSQELAQRFGNNYIDADHLFAAVIGEGDNGATQALASFGIDSERVTQAAQTILAEGERKKVPQEMVFTPAAKQTIELAFLAAQELQHRYIASEHLALGYLRAASHEHRLLTELNVNPKELERRIVEHARSMPPGLSLRKPTLDEVFAAFGGVKTELDELWSRLSTAVQKKDLTATLSNAFAIARRDGLSAAESAERVLKFLEENPD
jgi:ATP-dependent Clp protease ATP-binding subunit ClpA